MADRPTQVKIAVNVDKNSVTSSNALLRQFAAEQNRQQRITLRQQLSNETAVAKAGVRQSEERNKARIRESALAARESAKTSKAEITAQTVITRETIKQNDLRRRAAEQETRTRQTEIAKQKRDVDGRAKYEYQSGQTTVKQYIAQLRQEEQAETQSYARRNRLLSQRQKLEAGQTPTRPGLSAGAGVVLGGVAGIAITGATVAAKHAIDLAADSENALNQLKFVTGATEAQMQKAGTTARELGADINLPATSSTDAAKAMLEMAKAGFDLQNSMDSAHGSLALAAAAETDAGTAAGITASLLKSFGLEGKEAGRVADLLAASANNSLGEIQDVAQATQQASAVFHSARFTVEDLTTDIALMANAGIKGSDAGTSLKTAIIALTSPTDTARAEMKRLHLELYDGTGKLKAHDEIIRLVSKALTGLSEEQRNAALKTIFGTDAIRAANIVFANGVDKVEAMRAKVTEYGAATDTAAAKNKGLKGSIDAFQSTLDSFAEKYGSKFLDPLAKGVNSLGEIIGLMDDYLDRQDKMGNKGGVLGYLPQNLRDLGDYIHDSAQDSKKQNSGQGQAAQARIDAQTFRNALGKNILFDDDQIGNTASKYGVKAERNDWTGRYDDSALLAASKAATKVYKDFLESERNARLLVSAQRGEKGEMMRLQGRTARETGGMAGPTRHVTTAEEEREAKRKAKEREQAGKKSERERESAEKKTERETLSIDKGSDKIATNFFLWVNKQAAKQKADTERFLKETQDLWDKGSQAIADANYTEAKNALDTTTDPKRIEELSKVVRDRIMEIYFAELGHLDKQFDRDIKPQAGESPMRRAAREGTVNARRNEGYTEANRKRDAELGQLDKQVQNANGNADTERIQQNEKALRSRDEFLNAERRIIERQIKDADKTHDYETEKSLINRQMLNEMDTARREFFEGYFSGDVSKISEGNAKFVEAQDKASDALRDLADKIGQQNAELDMQFYGLDPAQQAIKDQADPTSRGRDRFFQDANGMTRDKRKTDANGLPVKVDGAGIDALAAMTDAAKASGGDFFKALIKGESGRDALHNIGRNLGETFGDRAADFLQRKLIDGPLDKLFDSLADKMESGITGGGKSAGLSIANAALTLYNAANILGKGGKKKQRNSILGAALGFAAGSILPGVGNLEGAQIGAAIGGSFADGGYPQVGKKVLVGEEGPELVQFQSPARIYPADQTAQMMRGGGMGMGGSTTDARSISMPIYVDTINDRADADRLFGQLTDNLSSWDAFN